MELDIFSARIKSEQNTSFISNRTFMQSRNFEFLRAEWPELASLAGFAEAYCFNDPASANIKLRTYCETLVGGLHSRLRLPKPIPVSLMELLRNESFIAITPRVVIDKLHAIRIHGNKAAHGEKPSSQTSLWLIREAFDIGRWLCATYSSQAVENLEFVTPQAPSQPKADYKREKKALLEQHAKQEVLMQKLLAQLEEERARVEQLEVRTNEIEELRQTANVRGLQSATTLQFDEATTRKQLIDIQLASAGWQILTQGEAIKQDRLSFVTVEEEIHEQPTPSGVGYADYVLWDEGLPIAVIEAKKTSVDAEKGRHQAKHYADGLETKYGQRPIIFYTNGHDIWIWDDNEIAGYPPRKLYAFYSKDSLQRLLFQHKNRRKLSEVSSKPEILGERIYQHEALRQICERFQGKHRKALAVQATGTGKTRLSIAVCDVLTQANWVKRVLFLCDRRELRKQAKNAFSSFLELPVSVLSSKSVTDDANRVFVATYPAMQRIYENFDPGFFDLIIADESHRSIYNVHGDIFRYFDALQLGLTATPIEMISRSTCGLFGCDFKNPTTNYPLDLAVEEKYLVPYQVVKHTTKFLRDGINGQSLTADQVLEIEDQGIDPNTLEFSSSQIDQAIFNKDTNRKILQNLMDHGIRQADQQTLGKSIVFARNHNHAKLLEQLFNELYPQYSGRFCQVIDTYDPRAEQLIDDFKGEGSNDQLTLAISVDMLDTGIDVPEIVNLIFAKPVKSPVKFWQMVGRGTRLCENLFGPGKNKTHFQIFDHWGVVEYHGLKDQAVTVPKSKTLFERLFLERIKLAQTSLKFADPDFFENIALWLFDAIKALNEDSIAVKDKWKIKQQLADLDLLRQFSGNTVSLLENEMAPLMQWVDIRGSADAYQWDLIITKLQIEKFRGAITLENLIDEATAMLWNLQMNLNQTRAKSELIANCREFEWWKSASHAETEAARVDLRQIIRYQNKKDGSILTVPTIDITDSEEERVTQSTHLAAVDMNAYKARVSLALQSFENDATLKKIKSGSTVTKEELNRLNAIFHAQNPDLDLYTLQSFYDSATQIEQILRSIIGMESDVVNQKFSRFIQSHPELTSLQIQYLNVLKRQIAKTGSIQIAKLYDRPLSTIGEFDQLFSTKQQFEQLITIIKDFGNLPELEVSD
jgi:type I restriction enzyme, R subunit